jgi:branched-chain amino acid transport system substrate-binding protein
MKDMCRIAFKVSLFLFLFLCLIFTTIAKPAQAAEPIKIGTIMSITGWAGFIGTPQKEVFTAMIDDINAKGGVNGKPLELFYEDDKSIPTNAVIAATKLIKDKKVVAIVGTSTSDSALAIVPICEQEKIPFINSGPARILFKKWIFSDGPGDERGAKHLLEFGVKELGAKKIALLYSVDAMGTLGQKTITGDIGKYPGVSLVLQESFEAADTNMVPQLTKVKAANPDLIILFTTGGAAAVIAKNYKQLGMTTQVLGGSSITMPDFYSIAGKIAEESKWVFLSQPLMIVDKMAPNDPYRKNVWEPAEKFMQEKYGPTKHVTMFHASTFDALRAIIEAMKIAGKEDPASIRDALEKVRLEGFIGPFAPTATDHQASPIDPMRPMILKNGEYVPYGK